MISENFTALSVTLCLFSLLVEETEGGYVSRESNNRTQNVDDTEKHVRYVVGFWVYQGVVESSCSFHQ